MHSENDVFNGYGDSTTTATLSAGLRAAQVALERQTKWTCRHIAMEVRSAVVAMALRKPSRDAHHHQGFGDMGGLGGHVRWPRSVHIFP